MTETKVLLPGEETYTLASSLLRSGDLVAFPTETVYGLGANALNADAVRNIFRVKGRPADNPLIVHIFDRDQLEPLCSSFPLADILMDAFWPGPLTMLFSKKETVPSVVTAGLPTVAVRMPSHPVAFEMLKTSMVPVAAPSANRSGRPSPTCAAHVLEDMNGLIPLIIDGGRCDVGLESTVLDLSGSSPRILRPGGITQEMIEKVLGTRISVAPSVLRPLQPGEKALSPGMLYRHYSPSGTVTLVTGAEENVLRLMRKLYSHDTESGRKTCVLCFEEHVSELEGCSPHSIGPVAEADTIARNLFNILRGLDSEGMESIYSEVLPPEGIGLAIMNRLGRAAAFRTIDADIISLPY